MGNLYTSFSAQDRVNDFGALEYWFRKKMEGVNTIKLCRITKVNADGTYNTETLVNDINPYTNTGIPVKLQSVPALRQQGGSGGFIIGYAPGDIVLVGFCDKDIQAAARAKDFAAPGTALQFPLSSAIILGAVFYEEPAIFVKVTDKVYINGDTVTPDGITAGSVTAETASADNLTVNTSLTVDGTVTVSGQPGISTTFVDAGGVTHTVVNGIITT